ncbi:MAG: molybdopterin-synthase adenylyltransferase MoeB [Candidatus Eisenbacteria bacterium]|uniref:Molybdopterin-synthase adenylyltransferase MoeB n=1 Tax=Eiseniibacteriota bacterium TaxID=2212470 RepID=A0A538SG52_UNCEI|nr:MAG: molybdopterin-synthase adenylyltransferase MoeB [Candidatus Eisenbacteria bacterium]
MHVKILIPTPLRSFVGGAREVEVEARTVGDALQSLIERHAQLKKHLYGEDGKLRSFVNVYVNDEDVRYLKQADTPLGERDVLSIVPSVAGGIEPAVPKTAPPAPPTSASPLPLSAEEIRRYSRHLIMPEVGMKGQVKLKNASVLLIGAGGLGSPLALYLAAAGVGRIGIVDFDVVDESNLQRQLLHGTSDVGRPKLESARARLREVNPLIRIETHEARLTSENALELFRAYDIVADGTDNFPTRYLVNDACVLTGKPNVYGSIFRFEGQASVFATVEGPCYRCLYPEPPPAGLVPSCAEGGVLGVLPGIVGSIQACEVLKLILGEGTPLVGRLLLFDALAMNFRTLKLRRDPSCPVCGPNATIRKLIDYEAFCGIEAEIGPGTGEFELTPSELKKKIDRGEDLVLLDVREPQEWDISRIENARLIPLGRLPYALGELSTADEIVAFCRSGVRSRKALQLLREAGFRKVHNLSGGINAWAEKVDASVPRY